MGWITVLGGKGVFRVGKDIWWYGCIYSLEVGKDICRV